MSEPAKDEIPQKTFQRYRRRCSVTRYSLEEMSPPETVQPIEPTNIVTAQESDPSTPKAAPEPPPPRRRYGRRSSVTRYSLQDQTDYRQQTRSLSPKPLKRRGTVTKYTLEQVSNNESGAQINKEVVDEQPEHTQRDCRPPARYRRRCSVTKYSFDNTTPGEDQVVSVRVTVEEPMDTVNALEHRQMLANDTIESGEAGDLIVGWNQASADFFESAEFKRSEYGIETQNMIDSSITMKMKQSKAVEKNEDTQAMESEPIVDSENSTAEETYGSYLYRILRKNFAPSFLVSNIQPNGTN